MQLLTFPAQQRLIKMYFSLTALTNDDGTMHRRMQALDSQMSPPHSPRLKRNTVYYTKTDCVNLKNGLNVSFITVRPIII
jgi:hypothetical protein